MNFTDELRALEEKLLSSDFRRNREAVSELLAEDFREFGSSGHVWNKRQILDHLASEPCFTATLENFLAIQLATDVILVTYTVTTARPGSHNAASLRSSVWIKRDSRWQIVFHQGTPASLTVS